ncbi:MAG: MaoC family dehydratase [Spongiibacteraceae bacterium]
MAVIIKKSELNDYVGYQTEPTPWHKVTQQQINQFAACTLDEQFIHVDPERAKDTPFGTTIAHGFLTLSMLARFSEQYKVLIEGFYMGINSGFDKVRFLAPVLVNSHIRAVAKVLEIAETKPGQFRIKTEVTVEIQGSDKPALVAEWIGIQMTA